MSTEKTQPQQLHNSISIHGYLLIFSSVALSLLGLVMVYSITGGQALSKYFHSRHAVLHTSKYLYTQSLYIFAGMLAAFVAAVIRPEFYKKIMKLSVFGAIFLLITVLFFGININGARRWFRIAGISLQPMEISKIALVLYLAVILEKRITIMQDFVKGFVQPLAVTGFIILLLLLEPDFGSAVLFITVTSMLMFVAGSRLYYFMLAGSVAMPVFWYYVAAGWRLNKRIIPFLHPEEYSQGAAYQIIRSLDAFGSGGVWGWGLGDGPYKMDFLPEAHTDYIAAMTGQELGFAGIFVVILLYGLFLYAGISVAVKNRKSIFRFIFALGLTLMLVLQAVINLSVVMNLIPSKGITLPFMSFGGSSMLISFITAGLLLGMDIHPVTVKTENKKEKKYIVIGKQKHA